MNVLTKIIIALLLNLVGPIEEPHQPLQNLMTEATLKNCGAEVLNDTENTYFMLNSHSIN